jgi:acyl-CoA synthetase (NDP forming)
MPNTDFTRLFNPRGIAIIGASTEVSRPGGQTVHVLGERGYQGGIYPVNPKYQEIKGRPCYPTVGDVPGDCDLAVIALPAAQVPDAITQCGRRGLKFCVVLGGGFREAGPAGVEREQRMLAAAREAGVRLTGPNCLGLANIHDNVFAGFGSITRPPWKKPGSVSALIQSGGYGNSLLVQAADAGVGFRYIVATGSESDIAAPELIRAFVDDDKTRMIFAYLEGLADGRAFMEAARYALAAGKPLIVLKAGNSAQGRSAAASHTANLTADFDIYRAAFRQCGVIQAKEAMDAVDIMNCLGAGRVARGRKVAVTAGSGGSVVNFADACDEFGLTLAPVGEKTVALMKEILPPIAVPQNPVDYTTGFVTEPNAPKYKALLRALLADDNIDQLAVFHLTGTGPAFASTARHVVDAVGDSTKPVIVYSAMPPSLTTEARQLFAEAKVPFLQSPRRIALSMSTMADYQVALGRRERLVAGHSVAPRALPELPSGSLALDEHESKKLLEGFGVAVTRDVLLPLDARAVLPQGMRYPVAVKIVSRDIAHKTDIGAVRLNITDDAQLAAAVAEVTANARKAAPQAKLAGVLVSEMVGDGLETIIGVVNDAVFGPVVAFGLGGVLAETLRDMTYRIAPFGLEDAREMVGELRASAVFSGLRGRAPRDVDALAKTLVAVSECAWLMRERLAEMDINPVLVRAAGEGVAAADALVVLR